MATDSTTSSPAEIRDTLERDQEAEDAPGGEIASHPDACTCKRCKELTVCYACERRKLDGDWCFACKRLIY